MGDSKDSDTLLLDLLRQARAGDERAYAAFLQGITPLIRMMLGTAIVQSQRDDVVQDILLSVHRALPTYDAGRALRPWLNAIVNYRKLDALRQVYKSRAEQPADIEASHAHRLVINPATTAGELKDIKSALDKLGVKQRRILELLRFQGLSIDETAKAMGVSANDVKISAHRATAKLREMLGVQ
ncbi:MAG: sigma-70 family RNA polymerase sigma factor [Pseudomonadota bacterium]